MPLDPRENPPVDESVALEHGLSAEEYRRILEILGRTPTWTEIGVFSLMWSEHCSYKSSRVHLKAFPTSGPRVLQGPGENAGIVDIGGGYAVAFKMESHNHPSYVEPYQGAATGVGGILRDIFTMGARPIASLDSLRFGSFAHPRTRYLLGGVVAGIGGYGNTIGVPTVGGELGFHPSYDGNCLVNAFNLGVLRSDRIFRGKAAGVGNPILYVGSKTGRDGIHGASLLASAEFGASSEEKRPTVQVGDPFTEKLLLEACLDLMESGCIVGIQDMGAAGLTSSSTEMAGRGGCGVVLDLDRIPLREEGMTAYEICISESQERMLIVLDKGTEERAATIFAKWDLDASIIGEVTDDGYWTVLRGGETVARIPVSALTDEAPAYDRPARRPAWQTDVQGLDWASLPVPSDLGEALRKLLASPAIAGKAWVYTQYDSTVRTNTMCRPGGDAAVLRIKENGRAIAMTLDVNPRFCYLDPRAGAAHAVAEAARNLASTGAEPVGITDCLNFGNPEKPEIMWQFKEAVQGIAEACRALAIPIVSGNVSFYNETEGRAIYPTPTIGMVGLLEDPEKTAGIWFRMPGDSILLLGTTREEFGGSEYLAVLHGTERGLPPSLDLAAEEKLGRLLRDAIGKGIVESAHDCSEGGLAVALAECSFHRDASGGVPAGAPLPVLGCDVNLSATMRPDALLFGESAGRAVLSCRPENVARLLELARAHGVPAEEIGKVAERRIVVRRGGKTLLDEPTAGLQDTWANALERAIAGHVERPEE